MRVVGDIAREAHRQAVANHKTQKDAAMARFEEAKARLDAALLDCEKAISGIDVWCSGQ